MANLDFTVIGNLTAKPYFRRFDSGSTVLRFRVATSDAKKVTDDNGKDGWEDFNQFYVDVECWGQLAVNAGASLRKGFPVIVVGKLVHEYWEEKAADGTTNMRSRVKMKARYIGFDLARYQVNSVRATASGNTLDGHEPPTATSRPRPWTPLRSTGSSTATTPTRMSAGRMSGPRAAGAACRRTQQCRSIG